MIGKMDRKISIVESTTERTATGALKQSGTNTLFTDWCRLQPSSASKRLEYSKIGYPSPYDVTLSNRPDVTVDEWPQKCTAKIDGVEYQIISGFVSEDKMKIYLEVHK